MLFPHIGQYDSLFRATSFAGGGPGTQAEIVHVVLTIFASCELFFFTLCVAQIIHKSAYCIYWSNTSHLMKRTYCRHKYGSLGSFPNQGLGASRRYWAYPRQIVQSYSWTQSPSQHRMRISMVSPSSMLCRWQPGEQQPGWWMMVEFPLYRMPRVIPTVE